MKDLITLVETFNEVKSELKQVKESENLIIEKANEKLNMIKNMIQPYQIFMDVIGLGIIRIPLDLKDSWNNKYDLRIYNDNIELYCPQTNHTKCLEITKNQTIKAKGSTMDFNNFIIDSDFVKNLDINKIIEQLKTEMTIKIKHEISEKIKEIEKYQNAIEEFTKNNIKERMENIITQLITLNEFFKRTGDLELIDQISEQINKLEEIWEGGE